MENEAASADHERKMGLLYGLFIGDALAMPVHWYYDRRALHRDYGWVSEYLGPKEYHPDSILFRSHFKPLNERADILQLLLLDVVESYSQCPKALTLAQIWDTSRIQQQQNESPIPNWIPGT